MYGLLCCVTVWFGGSRGVTVFASETLCVEIERSGKKIIITLSKVVQRLHNARHSHGQVPLYLVFLSSAIIKRVNFERPHQQQSIL